MIKNKFKIIILILLIIILSIIGVIFYIQRTTMSKSKIFVCDNPKHHSEFDNWILNECNVNWVPSYIIIKNDKVIGIIDGNISEKEFTSKLGSILINEYSICNVPNYKIINLEGDSYTLSELTPNKDSFYILEISWANCKDCEIQDKQYTKSIYNKYSTKNIIRYYINSEKDDVLQYY